MIKTSTNASSAAYFLHEQNDFELFVYCMPLWFYEMEGPYASETDYKNAYREKTVHEYDMRSDLSEEDRDKAIRMRLQSYDDYFCLANDAAVQFGWAGDIDDGPDIFHAPDVKVLARRERVLLFLQ